LGPLPQGQLTAKEWDEVLEAVWSGEDCLRPVLREHQAGKPTLRAAGCERAVSRRGEVAGQPQHWTARRFIVRSVRQAQAAETALRARGATAMAQMEALNQRGRGTKRLAAVAALRQAVLAIVPR
jgi:hypothetical protein